MKRSYGTLLGFLLIVGIFTLMRPGIFLSSGNLLNILEQGAILAIIAATMTVVMVVGEFDLSVGTLAGVIGVVTATLLLDGYSIPTTIAISIALGALAGMLNGLLVAYFRLSAFVATLATMTSFRGIALLITDGATLFGLPRPFRVIGQGSLGLVPYPVIIMAAVMVIIWFVLTQTTIGRRWYAVGGNPQAAFLSGINVKRLTLGAFVVSGMGAALAGVVLTSRLASAHPLAGEPFMLTAIASVFLGMTISREGEANIPGTMIGVLILGVLSNGLNIMRVNSYIQDILTGIIIIVAVLAAQMTRRKN